MDAPGNSHVCHGSKEVDVNGEKLLLAITAVEEWGVKSLKKEDSCNIENRGTTKESVKIRLENSRHEIVVVFVGTAEGAKLHEDVN